MKRLWALLGRIIYWVTLPGIYLVLRRSKRTRLALVCKHKILVVKPWLGNGRWALPGGGMKKRELSEDALRREVKEELAITLPKNRYKKISQLTYKQNCLRFDYTLFGALVKKEIPLKPRGRELVEVAWMPWDALSVRNANCDVIETLKKL